jgi:NAD-dependent dihydropyrimidine dehydrogenase PreA subunit
MSERGMGSAVGQVPEYIEMVARWVKQHSKLPCIVKLTPNITDIRNPARAAFRGGADAVSLINTINSITSVDLDLMAPTPTVDGKGTHGGYCGPAVRPIALNMVAEIARDRRRTASRSPRSAASVPGATRRSSWRSARLGAGLHRRDAPRLPHRGRHDHGPVELDGREGLRAPRRLRRQGRAQRHRLAVPESQYDIKARINQDLCIKCGLCHIACEDTAHQAISKESNGHKRYEVIDAECVGCNLCMHVCPVDNCITMQRVDDGGSRTGPRTRTTRCGKPRSVRRRPSGRRSGERVRRVDVHAALVERGSPAALRKAEPGKPGSTRRRQARFDWRLLAAIAARCPPYTERRKTMRRCDPEIRTMAGTPAGCGECSEPHRNVAMSPMRFGLRPHHILSGGTYSDACASRASSSATRASSAWFAACSASSRCARPWIAASATPDSSTVAM